MKCALNDLNPASGSGSISESPADFVSRGGAVENHAVDPNRYMIWILEQTRNFRLTPFRLLPLQFVSRMFCFLVRLLLFTCTYIYSLTLWC